MTNTDSRLAATPLAAARLGLKLIRMVEEVWEQVEAPAEREYHIEVCEAPVRGRAFAWRRLDNMTRTHRADAVRAMDFYKSRLSHTVIECERVVAVHPAE